MNNKGNEGLCISALARKTTANLLKGSHKGVDGLNRRLFPDHDHPPPENWCFLASKGKDAAIGISAHLVFISSSLLQIGSATAAHLPYGCPLAAA